MVVVHTVRTATTTVGRLTGHVPMALVDNVGHAYAFISRPREIKDAVCLRRWARMLTS